METKILITIDTEVRSRNRDLPDPYEQDVIGRLSERTYGACWIANQLTDIGCRGVFFLDVYGSAKYGSARYRELCDRLLEAGHDIQLHTHPDQMFDARRRHMHEYNLEEQTTIVREGMAMLKDWTGRAAVAHRAGRYGANEDTLKALERNRIYLDSSFFYRRADCQLPFGNTNLPTRMHGVREIPVTVVPVPVVKLGVRFPVWTRRVWKNFQKLDVNCMSASQLCAAVMELYGRIPYIIIFLHSFSFTRREPTGFVLDQSAVESFQALLQLLVEKEMPVVTFSQISHEFAVDESVGPGVVTR